MCQSINVCVNDDSKENNPVILLCRFKINYMTRYKLYTNVILNWVGSQKIHRQNVKVTNAEWTERRTTKRRMGHNAECQNVE